MESELTQIGWSDDLETGIDVLDAQHHRYFDLLDNYLVKTTEKSTTPEQILDLAETFNFLRKYAEEHFSTEESIMEKTDYPEFGLHQEEHAYFLHHVQRLYECLKKEGFSPDLAREVHYYTVEWFIEHINLTDVKLVNFLNKQAVEDIRIPVFLKKMYTNLFGK